MPIDLQTDNGRPWPRGDAGNGPAGARPCTAAQHSTTDNATRARAPTGSCTAQHSTAQHNGRRRPAGLVHDRQPTGQAPRARRPAVHGKNPAGRLDRLRAHKPRHDRHYEKQETSMHAREMCTRRRPTTAGGALPPLRWTFPHTAGCLGYPLALGATPLTGVHPHLGGFADLADRISKASCYRIPLTFFFGNSAAAIAGCS
jgi:hypothetical protein